MQFTYQQQQLEEQFPSTQSRDPMNRNQAYSDKENAFPKISQLLQPLDFHPTLTNFSKQPLLSASINNQPQANISQKCYGEGVLALKFSNTNTQLKPAIGEILMTMGNHQSTLDSVETFSIQLPQKMMDYQHNGIKLNTRGQDYPNSKLSPTFMRETQGDTKAISQTSYFNDNYDCKNKRMESSEDRIIFACNLNFEDTQYTTPEEVCAQGEIRDIIEKSKSSFLEQKRIYEQAIEKTAQENYTNQIQMNSFLNSTPISVSVKHTSQQIAVDSAVILQGKQQSQISSENYKNQMKTLFKQEESQQNEKPFLKSFSSAPLNHPACRIVTLNPNEDMFDDQMQLHDSDQEIQEQTWAHKITQSKSSAVNEHSFHTPSLTDLPFQYQYQQPMQQYPQFSRNIDNLETKDININNMNPQNDYTKAQFESYKNIQPQINQQTFHDICESELSVCGERQEVKKNDKPNIKVLSQLSPIGQFDFSIHATEEATGMAHNSTLQKPSSKQESDSALNLPEAIKMHNQPEDSFYDYSQYPNRVAYTFHKQGENNPSSSSKTSLVCSQGLQQDDCDKMPHFLSQENKYQMDQKLISQDKQSQSKQEIKETPIEQMYLNNLGQPYENYNSVYQISQNYQPTLGQQQCQKEEIFPSFEQDRILKYNQEIREKIRKISFSFVPSEIQPLQSLSEFDFQINQANNYENTWRNNNESSFSSVGNNDSNYSQVQFPAKSMSSQQTRANSTCSGSLNVLSVGQNKMRKLDLAKCLNLPISQAPNSLPSSISSVPHKKSLSRSRYDKCSQDYLEEVSPLEKMTSPSSFSSQEKITPISDERLDNFNISNKELSLNNIRPSQLESLNPDSVYFQAQEISSSQLKASKESTYQLFTKTKKQYNNAFSINSDCILKNKEQINCSSLPDSVSTRSQRSLDSSKLQKDQSLQSIPNVGFKIDRSIDKIQAPSTKRTSSYKEFILNMKRNADLGSSETIETPKRMNNSSLHCFDRKNKTMDQDYLAQNDIPKISYGKLNVTAETVSPSKPGTFSALIMEGKYHLFKPSPSPGQKSGSALSSPTTTTGNILKKAVSATTRWNSASNQTARTKLTKNQSFTNVIKSNLSDENLNIQQKQQRKLQIILAPKPSGSKQSNTTLSQSRSPVRQHSKGKALSLGIVKKGDLSALTIPQQPTIRLQKDNQSLTSTAIKQYPGVEKQPYSFVKHARKN